MVVLRILETSLYLFFRVIANYIEVDLVSFLKILGYVLVVEVLTNLIEIFFESAAQVLEPKVVAELNEDKFERNGVPVVHSLMIFKMCEGLGLPAQLAAKSDRQMGVAENKSSPIPKVHSKTILMFCETLNLEAELAH
ncbi:hypothetical protein TNCV_1294951 [Trichonephila clavipes]|nr:hypothetical protein TNCV_1294951 [Trichonephila clavipes]